MKKILVICATACMVLGFSASLMADDSDTTTVNYSVAALDSINIDDAAVTLDLTTDEGDGTFTDASATATYDCSTNAAAMKITGAIDSDMPAGMTLTANADATGLGTSAGPQTISASAADLVTAISASAANDLNLVFNLDAPITQAATSGSRTFTLTLTNS